MVRRFLIFEDTDHVERASNSITESSSLVGTIGDKISNWASGVVAFLLVGI